MIAARAFFSTSTRRARKKREWELGRAGEDNFPQITLTEPELWSSSPREQLSGIVSRWPRVLGQFPPPAASASRGLKGFLSFFLSLFLYLSISFFFFFPFLPTEQRVSNAIRGRTVFAMGEREWERERERRERHAWFFCRCWCWSLVEKSLEERNAGLVKLEGNAYFHTQFSFYRGIFHVY